MKFLVALCFLSTAVSAFYIQPQTLGRTRVVIAAKKQEQEGYKVVDAARAKECAENFGKCSLDEIKKLRDDLHQERLQNLVFKEDPKAPPSDVMWDHRILEEELELQLNLLQTETPDPSLFPEDEDEMAVLPHLKDGAKKKKENPVLHKAEDLVHEAEVMAIGKESLLDEETMETMVICLAIAGLIFLPQLFHI